MASRSPLNLFIDFHDSPTMFSRSYILNLVVSAMCVAALTACGKKEEKVATQVAAKVGKEEISVHQINQVLGRVNTSGATPEAAQNARKAALERLIDQQLAVDQAMSKNLQRSPEVVSQLEAARRDVLARAYIQSLTANLPKPTPEETKKYFADHPELFSERRVYNLQEIVVPPSESATARQQLKSLVAAGKPIEEMVAFLRSQNVRFGGNSASRAAEQIPLEILNKLHSLKDGQTTVIETPQGGVTVLRVAGSQSATVTEAQALPRIEQFLLNQKSAEAVAQNIKQLRAGTTVEYMGEFQQAAGAAAQPPGAASAMPEGSPSAPRLGGDGVLPAAGADSARSALEKGVAGLK